MDPVSPKKFMRIPEFCEYAGISRDRVYRLAKAGKIPLVRLGGSTLVVVDKALEFLDNLPDYRAVPPSYWGGATTPPRARKKKPTK
jgi:excisionase family DNA binding protein